MKGRKLLIPIATFILALSMGLAACGNSGDQSQSGGDNSQSEPPAKQEKISVEAEGGKKALILGEKVQLTAKVGDAVLEGVTWESAKPDIASVDANGLVTSVSKGSATIKAIKDGYKDGSISISVDYETIKVSVAEGGKTSLLIGETVQLNADKQGVTWTSSDATIAEVSNTGLVTAKKIGSATITASGNNLNSGSQEINVVRPAPTATLHMEDADHFSSDGTWGTSYSGTMYGPGDESPVYARSSGNASDGTCIAYMDNGDTEELKFSSNAAVKAELVMTMASRSAVSDMSSVMDVTFNGETIDLAGKEFAGGGDTNTFLEFSFGDVNIKNGENALHFTFKASSPYMDDLNIYAEGSATITVIQPAAKPEVTVNEESLTIREGKTAQITSSLTELSYKSNNTAIATVDENGLVTGVKVGETTISVSKDGYKTIKVPVTVNEAEGVIVVQVEDGTSEGDVVTFKTSNNLDTLMVNEWPTDAVLTLTVNAETAGKYSLYMNARAHGGYSGGNTDDLATCMEVKINGGDALSMTGEVTSGAFKLYLLGEVTLNAGPNTMTVKNLTDIPTIDLFRFIPVA